VIEEGNRHHRRGWGSGPSRQANGLIVAGVVLKAFRPDDQPNRKVFSESSITGILCQVLVYTARNRAILDNVPVALHRLGTNDAHLWLPKAATMDVTGGELVLDGDPDSGVRPTAPHNMDGDHVLVSFLANDLNQPVITGFLPHPQSFRRPSSNNALYQLERWSRGNHFAVTDAGDVVVDTTAASDGTQAADGSEQASAAAGNLTLTLKSTATVRIEIDGSNTVIEADSGKVTIKADAVEFNDPAPGDGVCRIGDATSGHTHVVTVTGTADLVTGVVTATGTAVIATDTMAQGSATVRAGG